MADGFREKIRKQAQQMVEIKRFVDKDPEGLAAFLEEYKERRRYRIPEDRLRRICRYEVEILCGRPCLLLRPHGREPERAVLYFYGSGYFQTPAKDDMLYAAELCRDTCSEVWFPLYPLAPEADISVIMEHAAGLYREMLTRWDSERIVWQGNSSGGTTCLYLCLKIRHDGEALPWPARILLVSPAVQMPPSDLQADKMREIEERDHQLPVAYCYSIAALLSHPDYEYLKQPFAMDWTGFPRMMVVYGTDEIFFAFLQDLRDKARESRVPMKGITGNQKEHCWPYKGSSEDARRVRQKLQEYIRDDAWRTEDEGPEEVPIVHVYTADDDLEARMVMKTLEENDIPCFRKEESGGFMALYGGNARMTVYLYVAQKDAKKAETLLNGIGRFAEWEEDGSDPEPEDDASAAEGRGGEEPEGTAGKEDELSPAKCRIFYQQYLQGFDLTDEKVRLKIVHTEGVIRFAKEIARREGLSGEDQQLAEIIAMLHDIGRYEQIRRYDSFEPATMDHASYGAELLFGTDGKDEPWIRSFITSDAYDEIIRTAIALHSGYELPPIEDPRVRLHAQLIRDADKLDNCRVKLVESVELLLGLTPEEVGKQKISDKVWQACLERRSVYSPDRVTRMDYWVSYVAYLFDLSFASSRRIVLEKDFVDQTIDRIPYTDPDTREKMEQLRHMVKEALA